MTTFFQLPPEIRNDIYKRILCGRRLKFIPQPPRQQQKQQQKKKQPAAPPLGRNALLIASRRCHQEALAILWTYVELNITDMISADTIPHAPPPFASSSPSPQPSPQRSLPPSQLLILHNLHRLVLDGGQGGKLNDRASAALLSLCPSLTSVTLLCGEQYEVSLLKADPAVAVFGAVCRALITRIIRASPWRVLGTKFWRPRKDLFGFMRVWKMRNGGGGHGGSRGGDQSKAAARGGGEVVIQQGGFRLNTEFQIVVRAVNDVVAGTWDGRFNLDTRMLTISPPGCGFGDEQGEELGSDAAAARYTFPLEMLEL